MSIVLLRERGDQLGDQLLQNEVPAVGCGHHQRVVAPEIDRLLVAPRLDQRAHALHPARTARDVQRRLAAVRAHRPRVG